MSFLKQYYNEGRDIYILFSLHFGIMLDFYNPTVSSLRSALIFHSNFPFFHPVFSLLPSPSPYAGGQPEGGD